MARVVVVVGALVAALMLPFISHDVGYAQQVPQELTYTYAENGTDEVASYTATDPEGKKIFWSVAGDDAGEFNVDDGSLTFKNPPDYEDPTDSGADNVYAVTVEAGDGGESAGSAINVTVTVTNAEEDGTVTLSSLQPMVGITQTASVADPDKITNDTADTWQWASSPDGTTWTDIADATTDSYEPVLGDAGNLLRATATYTNGKGKTEDISSAVSANPTRTRPNNNRAPEFPDQDPDATGDQSDAATRDINEDIAAGRSVGNAVSANDTDGDILTYKLGGADPDLFDIDRATGQISVAAGVKFNYEAKPKKIAYKVTVTATDPFGPAASDLINVTINLIDVNEAPEITPDLKVGDKITTNKTKNDYDEDEDGKETRVGPYSATDDQTLPADLDWSLSGVDADSFEISDAGVLSFEAQPDFENPGDSGSDNIYELTVEASDVDNRSGTISVTVKVKNTDEDGTVTLSNRQPEVGVGLTASLSDPDGVVGAVTWAWEVVGDTVKSTDTTSPTYEPQEGDLPASGKTVKLKATANYTDNEGSDKSMSGTSEFNLQPRSSTNTAPVFPDEDGANARSIAEKSESDSVVGNPIAATDANVDPGEDQRLTYTLSGADAALFDIDMKTGQIRVGEGTELDYEGTKKTYTVGVTATDGSGASASVTVPITVDDVNEVPTVAGPGKVDYAENGTGPVANYTASDPEGSPISWTLDGLDAEDFSITAGALSFKSPPDFENPTGGVLKNFTEIYKVTVVAGDGRAEPTDSKVVTVTVTNVEEPGAVTLRLLQPQVGAKQTAKLADSDGITSGESWQWAGSSDGETGWADIEGAKSETYTPKSTDVGNFLRATVNYTDPNGDAVDTAADMSAYATRARPSSNAQPKYDPNTKAINVAENTAAGQNVGDVVTATDADGDVLTYELSGTDAGSFELDKATAQITVAAGTSLNFEADPAKPTYTVTVRATDPAGTLAASDTSTVTITVTNVNEAPSIASAGGTAFNFDEDTKIDDKNNPVAKFTATDPDAEETQTWSLAGADGGKFKITEVSGTQELRFKAEPDFEEPGDSDADNVYEVTVVVSDKVGNDDELDVTVSVENAVEKGNVSLSTLQPEVGIGLTATVSDPDGIKAGSVKWQWGTRKNLMPLTKVVEIEGATSDTYVPIEAQAVNNGLYLVATATYTDGKGEDTQLKPSAHPVQPADSTNNTPEFDSDGDLDGAQTGPLARTVPENSEAETDVGKPVTAKDDDILTYSFGGADAALFKLDRATGQITVGAGTNLDYETRTGYTVTVTATDPSNASATATVNITVTDVNEVPVIAPKLTDLEINGSSRIDYAENGTDAAATYTAAGPQSDGAVWSISGADSGDFAIDSSTGELTFGASPDFETPTDADADNVYNVTVEAASGTYSATFGVVVTVTNEDEDGVVTLSAQQPVIGTEITAELTDPDGLTAGTVSWQWAAGATADGISENISGADAAAYTPVAGDDGMFLSVKASYDDSHGAEKSAVAVASSAVSDVVGPMSYDANGNGTIERGEVLTAIDDYFDGLTTRQIVLDLIDLYFG